MKIEFRKSVRKLNTIGMTKITRFFYTRNINNLRNINIDKEILFENNFDWNIDNLNESKYRFRFHPRYNNNLETKIWNKINYNSSC